MTINWLPWHGLWKAGQMALPNATNKAMPDPHVFSFDAVGYGNVSVIRRPGWTAPARTPAEAAADAAAGKGWRGYALISGTWRNVGSERLNNGFVYFDPAGKAWWIQWTSVHQPRPVGHAEPDLCSITVTIRRFGLFDGEAHASATLSAQTGSGVTIPVSTVWAPGDGAAALICHKSDGSEAIFGRYTSPSFHWGTGQIWPILFWRLRISGTGNEALPGHGLSIEWDLVADEANWKFTNTTQIDTLRPTYKTRTYTKVEVSPGICNIDGGISGGTMFDRTTVRTSRQTMRLYCAYDQNDVLRWVESDYQWTESIREWKQYVVMSGTMHLYELPGGGLDVGNASVRQDLTTTTSASGSATLSWGGAVLLTVSKSIPESSNTVTTATGEDSLPTSWITEDPPGGIPYGSGSTSYDLGDDEHTSSSTVSSFGQGSTNWGIGYPTFYSADQGGGIYRISQLVRYSDQVLGLIELDVPGVFSTSPVTRQQLVDAWAPSGAHAGFGVAAPRPYPQTAYWTGALWNGRFATWQPVTDQLVVDTAPVVWF